jgi:hypothetical protein
MLDCWIRWAVVLLKCARRAFASDLLTGCNSQTTHTVRGGRVVRWCYVTNNLSVQVMPLCGEVLDPLKGKHQVVVISRQGWWVSCYADVMRQQQQTTSGGGA